MRVSKRMAVVFESVCAILMLLVFEGGRIDVGGWKIVQDIEEDYSVRFEMIKNCGW